MEKLKNIQAQLKAPKDLKNTFSGYFYRSCEGILEAVKPLLSQNETVLTINDEIVEVGGRIYVKATASLFELNGNLIASSSAFAREEESKKGIDSAQLTGSTSSYARKYALNGLFCIDDNKDADDLNKGDNGNNTPKSSLSNMIKRAIPNTIELVTEEQLKKIDELGLDKKAICQYYNIDAINKLKSTTAQAIIDKKSK